MMGLLAIKENQFEDPIVRNLLSLCIYPALGRLEKVLKRYRTQSNLDLFAYDLDGVWVGCIGIKITETHEAVIEHIAVLPQVRQKGVGSTMIRLVSDKFSLRKLDAETDNEAVDFYRKFGFSIKSLGEKYPGVERFLCELKIQEC